MAKLGLDWKRTRRLQWLASTVAIDHIWLFEFKLIKLKNAKLLSHTNHISNAQHLRGWCLRDGRVGVPSTGLLAEKNSIWTITIQLARAEKYGNIHWRGWEGQHGRERRHPCGEARVMEKQQGRPPWGPGLGLPCCRVQVKECFLRHRKFIEQPCFRASGKYWKELSKVRQVEAGDRWAPGYLWSVSCLHFEIEITTETR